MARVAEIYQPISLATETQVETELISCKVPNFRQYYKFDSFIKKQTFDFLVGGYKWRLCLIPKAEQGTKYLFAFIRFLSRDDDGVIASFTVENGVETWHVGEETIQCFHGVDDPIKSVKLFELTELYMDHVSADHNLKLLLNFKIHRFYPASMPSELTLTEKVEQYQKRFSENYDNHMKNCAPENNKDVVKFISKDVEVFQVPRRILCVRSPVFQVMFATPMTESSTGIVPIPDISSKAMEVMLEYIQTGQLHPNWRKEATHEELCFASVKYQLIDLAEFLEATLENLCTKANCLRLACMASKLEWKEGEKQCLEYFKENVNSVEQIQWEAVPEQEGNEVEVHQPKRRRLNNSITSYYQ